MTKYGEIAPAQSTIVFQIFAIELFNHTKPRQIRTNAQIRKMAGNELDEPYFHDYCDVVNIGEVDEDDSEATIFYQPGKGLNPPLFHVLLRPKRTILRSVFLMVILIGFRIPNAYLVSKKERTSRGRHYTRLDIISTRANRLIVRRYDNGGKQLDYYHFNLQC